MITGVDIVAEQVRIAEGHALTLQQEDIRPHGYALEARINAEDPRNGFVPTSGRITSVKLPAGPFTRVDSHIYPGYDVPTQFDSLLAKICVWGPDREAARRRMVRCLSELELRGPGTTTVFHEALLAHPRWQRGEFSTNFINEEDEYFADWYRSSNVGDDGDETMLAGFLPQWQQQQQFQPVLAPHESSWQSQGRKQAQERMQ
jgi:acetyl-CoA carboxylase biotin carboxylase subunit